MITEKDIQKMIKKGEEWRALRYQTCPRRMRNRIAMDMYNVNDIRCRSFK